MEKKLKELITVENVNELFEVDVRIDDVLKIGILVNYDVPTMFNPYWTLVFLDGPKIFTSHPVTLTFVRKKQKE